jgi:hypothetical protein
LFSGFVHILFHINESFNAASLVEEPVTVAVVEKMMDWWKCSVREGGREGMRDGMREDKGEREGG